MFCAEFKLHNNKIVVLHKQKQYGILDQKGVSVFLIKEITVRG